MQSIKFTFMNRRLQHFLAAEQLTPTQFAESLGIQKSRLSHILSGRNKPGFDFIEKFISTFPGVNIEWFINGTGKMYKETTPAPSENSVKPEDPFSEAGEKKYLSRDENDDFADEIRDPDDFFLERDNSRNSSLDRNSDENQSNRDNSTPSRLDKNEIFDNVWIPGRQNRSISRITVFYSDGSFEEFRKFR